MTFFAMYSPFSPSACSAFFFPRSGLLGVPLSMK